MEHGNSDTDKLQNLHTSKSCFNEGGTHTLTHTHRRRGKNLTFCTWSGTRTGHTTATGDRGQGRMLSEGLRTTYGDIDSPNTLLAKKPKEGEREKNTRSTRQAVGTHTKLRTDT